MFFKRHKPLVILAGVLIILAVFAFSLQQKKYAELQTELAKIELLNVRTDVGTSKGKMGTALFGIILNHGERTIKVATMSVDFIGQDGEISKTHKFFPVNNFSFSDSLPLAPGQSKEFGFPIDELVPEDWSGNFTARLIDLQFKP